MVRPDHFLRSFNHCFFWPPWCLFQALDPAWYPLRVSYGMPRDRSVSVCETWHWRVILVPFAPVWVLFRLLHVPYTELSSSVGSTAFQRPRVFPVSSFFNVHASEPYVTIDQISAWISRAFSGLLIARLLHSVFSWAMRSRLIANLDLISSTQEASELKCAPRYLKECTYLRFSPATVTVTFIGVKSSLTFITSVFFTLIFMPNSHAAQCNRVTISWGSASVLAINTMSFAYRRFVTSRPPISNLPSNPSRAKRMRTSATMLKRYGGKAGTLIICPSGR